jgi:hypothetical protein
MPAFHVHVGFNGAIKLKIDTSEVHPILKRFSCLSAAWLFVHSAVAMQTRKEERMMSCFTTVSILAKFSLSGFTASSSGFCRY